MVLLFSVFVYVTGNSYLCRRKQKNSDMENENFKLAGQKGRNATLTMPALMPKVYIWMTLALLITGFTAFVVATNAALQSAIFGNSLVFWGLIIAELALVWAVSARIEKLSLVNATLLFVLYSVINGATLSVIFLSYAAADIATAFFVTAGTFAAMTLVGLTTKRDLSSLGGLCLMCIIGLLIATVVNLFLRSGTLGMIISYVGVLVFVGLTAYDTNKIKNALQQNEAGNEETAAKIALIGALALYLDFINIFLYLLRIFGNRD